MVTLRRKAIRFLVILALVYILLLHEIERLKKAVSVKKAQDNKEYISPSERIGRLVNVVSMVEKHVERYTGRGP